LTIYLPLHFYLNYLIYLPLHFCLNYFPHRNCLWILGDKETLIKSNTIWSKLVSDAIDRCCCFDADDDQSLARVITEFKDKNSSSPSRCNQLDIDVQVTNDITVEATIEEAVIDLLPNNIPSRKRSCSLREDQLAGPEAPHVGEEARKRFCSLSEYHLARSEVGETTPAQAGEEADVMQALKSLSKTEIDNQSSSGSKRSAEELQLSLPKEKRTAARKVSDGQVAAGESTRLPDQLAAEPAPSSASSIPAESSTAEPLLSAGKQIEAPLRDTQVDQGPSVEQVDHLATIAALKEQVESLKEKNKILAASLKG
jgi:hypothetical protein